MNALACLVILNFLILLRWRGNARLRTWRERVQSVLQEIEARHYDLTAAPDDPLIRVFQQLIQAGRLQPSRIRSLLAWIRRLDLEDAARLRLGYGSAFRLGLGATVGLLAALLIEGSWMIRLAENPLMLLLLLSESLILFLWLQRLKPHPLAACPRLQADFTTAWLGQSRAGPWHEAWMELQNEGLANGRDRTLDQSQVLEDWILEGGREQEKRMIWAEELFGLVELAGSVYFLGTACALPLLKQWGAWD